MSDVGYASGLLVGGILVWAAAAKLRDPRGTGVAFRGMGLPLPRVLALAVPVVEVTVAVTLLLRPSAGAVAAVALLLVFTVLLAAKVVRRETVDCGCFGSAPQRPVSVSALVRNGLLTVAAAAALWAEPARPSLEALIVVSTASAAVVVTFALADLRRATGRLWRNTLSRGPAEEQP